jgi:hypothetical protein
MAAAGYRRRDYRLVLSGYASPFPAARWLRYPETGWSRLTEGGCPIWDADADWAAGRGIDSVVATLRAAAAAGGAEFLDLRHALDGHQLCDRRSRRVGDAGPSETGAEWVRRLSLTEGTRRESLHPNAYGQRALGRCLALLYARRRGEWSCRAEPHRQIDEAIGIEPLGGGLARKSRMWRLRRQGRWRGHQLDPLAARQGHDAAGHAPVLAVGLGVEAVLAQALEGGVEVGDVDREVAAGRDRRVGLVHQVDLGALALDPGEALGERGRRLDPLEAEQLEEEDGALDLLGSDLDADVLEHQKGREARATTTTIAVDQATASATVRLSRP